MKKTPFCATCEQDQEAMFQTLGITDFDEFVFSGQCLSQYGIHTLDLAKGMIDRGIHPPTGYFPLKIPEVIMIEPTESEGRDTLDNFVKVMEELVALAKTDPDQLHKSPITTPVGRRYEIKAARDMRLSFT